MTDTSLGGPHASFPVTQWTQLLDRRGGMEARRDAAAALARDYWRPVYIYVRAKWAKSNEDAKDLTQDFFVYITETDLLARVERHGGRFRAFVKVALDHFLIDEDRRTRAQKRGGDRKAIPLDHVPVDIPPAAGRTPEQILDDAWRAEILARAVEILGRQYQEEGKTVYFRVFQDFYWAAGEPPGYRDLAAKHGISEADVSNFLVSARRRLRETLHRLIAETVDSPAAGEDEFKSLFGA